jgi:magnesium chelatase subunit I
MPTIAPQAPSDLPVTLGDLRDSGYAHRTVKEEVRAHLIERLSKGEDPFPGIVDFDQAVRPQIERARD